MPLHPIGPEGSAGHQPGTPTIGSATASDASASVSFTAPDYLGKPIGTTYTATSTPGNITGTSSSSPITVSGLSNGTSYTFKVKLSNSITSSLESSSSNSITPVAPPSFPYFPPPPPTTYYASACCNGSQITSSSQVSEAAALAGLDCAGGYYSASTSTSGYPSVTCIYYATACCDSSGEASYGVSATGFTAILAQNALSCPGTLSSINVTTTPQSTPTCSAPPPSFPFFPPSFPYFASPSFPFFPPSFGPFFPPYFGYFRD